MTEADDAFADNRESASALDADWYELSNKIDDLEGQDWDPIHTRSFRRTLGGVASTVCCATGSPAAGIFQPPIRQGFALHGGAHDANAV